VSFRLDAVVLAADPRANVRIAGLTARERAIRVARRVGAARIHVIDGEASREQLARLRESRDGALLVIRADQLVHTPLVQPLIAGELPSDGLVVAVEDSTPKYAGAFVATGAAAGDALRALTSGDTDADIVARYPDARRVAHGAIARAPIDTPAQRRAAHALLYRILVKPQDNAITRYLYRPVSSPLTRLLAWTPITPNQISYAVAALVAFGCWLAAHASDDAALAGTAVILAASYLDCCDGEIARLKLLSSRFGAWVDTVVDELSSLGYMLAIGWHCHLALGPSYFGDPPFDPWLVAMAIGAITMSWAMYCIYYNIIVAVGSANSQDYVGKFDVVAGAAPNHVRLQPAQAKAIATNELPPWLAFFATYVPYVIRRDFISWAALALAALHLTHVAFGVLVLGGVVTFVIVSIDHVRLRVLRRAIAREGKILDAPTR
jgi:phosphatidylglycerophosphate synthase